MSRAPWNHNIAYFPFILGVIGEKPRRNALDVGSGDGMLAAQIAGIVPRVVGLDINAHQVDVAAATYGDVPGLTFELGDLLDATPDGAPFDGAPFDGAPFDIVTISATIHHLELAPALERLKLLTAPGGTLIVVGLALDGTFGDFLISAATAPIVRLARAVRGWHEHNAPKHDARDSWSTVRGVSRDILPGSIFKRCLYWRYTLVWNNTSSA